jgi:hypothetical protein
VASVGAACAEISVWQSSAEYVFSQDGRSISFLTPGFLKIDCYSALNEPADIDVIDAPGVDGPVYLYILPNPGDPLRLVGAANVHVIDLSGATESHIAGVKVWGQIADWDRPLKASSIAGEVYTDGSIVNGVDVLRLDALIHCGDMGDDFNVRDGSSGTHLGSVELQGFYAHTMNINGSLQGPLTITGLDPGASVTVTGNALSGVNIGSMLAPVTVTGNVRGASVGELNHVLTVGGGLLSAPGAHGLTVTYQFGPSGYVDVEGDLVYPGVFVEVQGRIVRVHPYAVLATGRGGSWPVCR